MRISIITSYYNRKKQFYETLKTISRSAFKDFEFIVVDDGSREEERIEDLVEEFPFIRLFRVEPKDKGYTGEIIPLNKAIGQAKGEIIVITCPEVLHVHDVLSYIDKNITEDNYLTMSTWSADAENTNKIISMLDNGEDAASFIWSMPGNSEPDAHGVVNNWYNHSYARPGYLHYCSAITRENMRKLNGFDERYANGIGWADLELVQRIKRLNLNLIVVDDIVVVHQFHESIWEHIPDYEERAERNKKLLYEVTLNETGYTANMYKWIFEQNYFNANT